MQSSLISLSISSAFSDPTLAPLRSRKVQPLFSHSSLNSGHVTAMSFPSSIWSASRNMANMSLGMQNMTLSKGRQR